MNDRQPHILPWLFVALMVAASLAAWPLLPENTRIPIHFDINGHADGFAAPWVGLFLMPAMAIGLLACFATLHRLPGPLSAAHSSSQAWTAITLALMVVFAALHGLILAHALGVRLDVARAIAAGIAILYLTIGNMAGKMRPNRLIGIRTPWTLADERVWFHVHRHFGWIFMLCGFVLLALAMVGIAAKWLVLFAFATALFTTAGAFVWSRRLYRRFNPG